MDNLEHFDLFRIRKQFRKRTWKEFSCERLSMYGKIDHNPILCPCGFHKSFEVHLASSCVPAWFIRPYLTCPWLWDHLLFSHDFDASRICALILMTVQGRSGHRTRQYSTRLQPLPTTMDRRAVNLHLAPSQLLNSQLEDAQHLNCGLFISKKISRRAALLYSHLYFALS
jgi:hypothetical protein